MTYVDGNYVSFICNLQQSPRLLKLCGGGKIEKVWGTFSTFFILGVLSHSLFFLLISCYNENNRNRYEEDIKVTHNRLAWDEYFAAQALLISNRATCNRAKVGAVLVKDNKVIATGYNGSVSGTDHCLEDGCLMVEGHCVRTIHAEVNAILQGAERGIPKGFTAYVTHFPCLNCTKQLLQVGCKRVVYIHQYRIDEYAEYLYREKEVELVNLPIEEVKRAIAEADFI